MSKLSLHPKVAAGGLSGLLAVIILWGVGHWLAVPTDVKTALPLLLSFVGSYLAPWIPKPPSSGTSTP